MILNRYGVFFKGSSFVKVNHRVYFLLCTIYGDWLPLSTAPGVCKWAFYLQSTIFLHAALGPGWGQIHCFNENECMSGEMLFCLGQCAVWKEFYNMWAGQPQCMCCQWDHGCESCLGAAAALGQDRYKPGLPCWKRSIRSCISAREVTVASSSEKNWVEEVDL